MQRVTTLVVEPDTHLRQVLQKSFPSEIEVLTTEESAVARSIRAHAPSLIILGPSFAKPEHLKECVERMTRSRIPLVLVTIEGSEALAVAALRAGICDYLKYPWREDEFRCALERCLRNRPTEQINFEAHDDTHPMLGEGKSMRFVRECLARVATSDCTILITGETGTGKELAAEFLHRESSRRSRPFVTVNCAAIPDSLLESELFGYEKGAFTGAHSSKDGKLKAANGGIVFLDEIGDMSLFAQAKILRAIEGKEIQRLGQATPTPVNVRIVAATNRQIEKLVAEEKFRKDLYYRLNVVRIHLPPLRERREDIPELVDYYSQSFSQKLGCETLSLTEQTWKFILSYDWPGNVRELKNFLEVRCLHGSSPQVASEQFQPSVRQHEETVCRVSRDEQKEILSALLSTNWNKSRAAEKLNWSRMTLYRKIAKYGVSRATSATVTSVAE